MKCNISISKYYREFCVKLKCGLYPCSQLVSAHRSRLGEVAHIKENMKKEEND